MANKPVKEKLSRAAKEAITARRKDARKAKIARRIATGPHAPMRRKETEGGFKTAARLSRKAAATALKIARVELA